VRGLGQRLLIAAILVFVAFPAASYFLTKSDEANSKADSSMLDAASSIDAANVQTMVSRESAESVTEADFDQAALSGIEARTLELFREKMVQEINRRTGKTLDASRLTADSVYAEISGRKLAVTTLRADGAIVGAQIAGIIDDEFLRVGCITNKPNDLEIVTGKCADAVKKTFGVTMVDANG
jgi:hypothetical protein